MTDKKKSSKKEEPKLENVAKAVGVTFEQTNDLTEKNETIDFSIFSMQGESESIANDLIKLEKQKETLLPYCFHLKNLTDEKLYDVDLFNYNHEKQNKIAYSCTNGVPYERFLRFLSSLNEAREEIILMRFVAVCDYGKFRQKQLNCCVHHINEEPNGRSVSTPNNLYINFSAYQQQSDIIDVPLNGRSTIKLFNQLQLRLSYLMPEAEVFITIFPSKID